MQYRSDRKMSTDLMFMLGLSEAMDNFAMANSVHWYGHVLRREDGYVLRREDGHVLRREDGHVLRREDGHVLRREDGHVLRREDGHVLRRALYLKAEDQMKKGRPKRTWKDQAEEKKCEDWCEKGRCTLSIDVECWRKADC